MKNLDCNQIETFINLEIIGEKDKNKKKIISILKKLCNLVKPLGTITTSKHNFYYITYDIYIHTYIYIYIYIYI